MRYTVKTQKSSGSSKRRPRGSFALASLAAAASFTIAPAFAAASTTPANSTTQTHVSSTSHAAPAVRIAAVSNSAIVGVAPTPGGRGYWMVSASGGILSYGNAVSYGSLANVHLAQPIVGIASTPDGKGYWLVASDGGIFSFGDARFFGSTGSVHLAQPIVGMASTPTGNGYWLAASDGGIFAFGDARFFGSTGGDHLNKPIVGMAATSTGNGYWLVASDGGIFSFGDAHFLGSTGGITLDEPIVGMAATTDGDGYWLVASDGGLFSYGDAAFHGSAVSFDQNAAATSVGMIGVGQGYWIPDNKGGVDTFAAGETGNASAPAVLPANVNPSASIAASSAFSQNCYGSTPNVTACNTAALADINSARSTEGLAALSLPSNFSSLSNVDQIIAIANAERTSRGLPAFPQNTTLNTMANKGATDNADPEGPNGYAWGSNISWGADTALATDFLWMYDDGTNSPNIDCSTASASGCWGHRENILTPWAGEAGAAIQNHSGTIVMTELFAQNY